MRNLIFFLLLFPLLVFAQKREIFRIDSLPKEGVLLNQGWKWHAGDNPEWAKAEYDDSKWKDIDPTKDIFDELSGIPKPSGVCWFRLHLRLDSKLQHRLLSFSASQSGASELYANGSRVWSFGVISSDPKKIQAFDPANKPIPYYNHDSTLDLAIRYTLQPKVRYTNVLLRRNPAFSIRLNYLENAQYQYRKYYTRLSNLVHFRFGVFIILLIGYLSLYTFYPSRIAYLYFSLFAIFVPITDISQLLGEGPTKVSNIFYLLLSSEGFYLIGIFCMLTALYALFGQKRNWLYWSLLGLVALSIVSQASIYYNTTIIGLIVPNFIHIEILRITLKSVKGRKKGALIIAAGGISFAISWVAFMFLVFTNGLNITIFNSFYTITDLAYNIAILSIPIAVSIYSGYEVALNNRFLAQKLSEVETLSIEKQAILATQNETLEHQVAERTTELSSKNRELEIEAALERVRSRTMEMQKSAELQKVTFVLYEQLKKLGFNFGASSITFMDAKTGDMDWWMEGFGDGYQFLEKYHVKYFDHPSHIEQLAHWRKGTPYAVISVVGEEKKSYDKFYFNETDFIRIPEKTKELMMQHEAVDFSMAYMQYGALSWSPTTLSDEQAKILQRFAKVFEQTYTRFLDLKKKEEQAVNLAEEKQKLERTLSELRATQAQLIQSEKLASLGELTAGIAHEIQNPLNFVNNFAEVSAEMLDEMHEELEKGDTTEAIAIATDLKTNLQKINHHGQRASAIVKGMLEHSRASTGVKEPIDLNTLADEYLRLAYHGLRAKDNDFNATMETHFDPDLPLISVIPQDIGRVILNLINNAFYAVNEKAKQGLEGYSPTVTISSRKLRDALEISIQDNGNGIPEAIKDKIFQPFFTTKPTGQGTGLGLSLAYDIVTKGHGGTLKVSSIPGEETTFELQFPTN